MTNYIFDLYGTLVDIHTNEAKASLWKNMAMFFSMTGAAYTPENLKKEYRQQAVRECHRQLPLIRDRFHDDGIAEHEIEIQLEEVFDHLLKNRGIHADKEQIRRLCILFRSLSLSYIRLYEGTRELLQKLKEKGKKRYLLSNAQRVFTEPEMKMLGIYEDFDGILYSSDVGVKKPSFYFYDTLFKKYGLKKEESLMIGNEYEADIEGSRNYGLKSIYVFTAQSGKRPLLLPEGCHEVKNISEIEAD